MVRSVNTYRFCMVLMFIHSRWIDFILSRMFILPRGKHTFIISCSLSEVEIKGRFIGLAALLLLIICRCARLGICFFRSLSILTFLYLKRIVQNQKHLAKIFHLLAVF